MKIKWEKKEDLISVAFVTVDSETSYGKPKKIKVALRVDGRSGSWRVDMATAIGGTTWMPFEAIDGGKGLSSESQAKAHAAKWLAAANDQMTLSPRTESKDTMPSLRSDMLQLLGETGQEDFQTHRAAGPTSTGATNKPAKKTPADKKPPPNVTGSDDEGEASAIASPKNSPAKKAPMKAGVAPPNVRGSGAVEHALRITRTYAGIDNRYGVKAGDMLAPPEEESYLATIQEDASEDPILKIAREAMRSPNRHHPFE